MRKLPMDNKWLHSKSSELLERIDYALRLICGEDDFNCENFHSTSKQGDFSAMFSTRLKSPIRNGNKIKVLEVEMAIKKRIGFDCEINITDLGSGNFEVKIEILED